jgi:hypothetical protein
MRFITAMAGELPTMRVLSVARRCSTLGGFASVGAAVVIAFFVLVFGKFSLSNFGAIVNGS